MGWGKKDAGFLALHQLPLPGVHRMCLDKEVRNEGYHGNHIFILAWLHETCLVASHPTRARRSLWEVPPRRVPANLTPSPASDGRASQRWMGSQSRSRDLLHVHVCAHPHRDTQPQTHTNVHSYTQPHRNTQRLTHVHTGTHIPTDTQTPRTHTHLHRVSRASRAPQPLPASASP